MSCDAKKYFFKVEQVAEVDVLPESDRMMSDRMRRGHGSLIWADDALVAVNFLKFFQIFKKIKTFLKFSREFYLGR